MQTNVRESMYTKLSKYHSKSREDVITWCEEVERIATANNWRAARIHMIIAAYLKEATADYYEKESVNINGWVGGNVTNNLKDLLVA